MGDGAGGLPSVSRGDGEGDVGDGGDRTQNDLRVKCFCPNTRICELACVKQVTTLVVIKTSPAKRGLAVTSCLNHGSVHGTAVAAAIMATPLLRYSRAENMS